MDARDFAAIGLGVGFFSPPLIGIFFVARSLSHRQLKNRPSAIGLTHVTPTGVALYGCQMVILFVGIAARQLQPQGPLGQFLKRPGGAFTYIVCLIIGFWLAGRALGKLGHPLIRRPTVPGV